tara:strand:+ start:210 stop:440 length:231 start_codon:yes stop_codon:yes gene_type:complete
MSKIKKTIGVIAYTWFIASLTSLVTMIVCIGLPTEEHVVIQNRALNYLDKTCYDMEDIEMIVFGEVLYDKSYMINK